MRTLSRKFFAIGLLLALLVCSTGRAVPVSALAELAPEVAPVFDTQIYQLQDYIDNGGLTDPQLDIFYIIAGSLCVGQLGAQDFKLETPYVSETNVKEWLINCGIQIYNSLIGLAPNTDPITGVDYRPMVKYFVAQLMGAAVVAKNYSSVDDFLADGYKLPITKDVQIGINALFSKFGGAFNWQFDTELHSNFSWNYQSLSSNNQAVYDSYALNMTMPRYFNNITYPDFSNILVDFSSDILQYHNLFFNVSNRTVYLYDDDGNAPVGNPLAPFVYYNSSTSMVYYLSNGRLAFRPYTYPSTKDKEDILQEFLQDGVKLFVLSGSFSGTCSCDISTIVQNIYYGTSWVTRLPFNYQTDLNLSENYQPYYYQVNNDYLLDIGDLIANLVNDIDLFDIIFRNLLDRDQIIVQDPELIKVTTEIRDFLEEQNPPIPVNLNDIDTYTNNTYMDIVKDRATAASSTLAALVAFWHNCDPEIIYVFFGAGLTVLVGAFIGKWGHS